MRLPAALGALLLAVTIAGTGRAQPKPEATELQAWVVRDVQMSAQFVVADRLGFFRAEGVKVVPRWYVNPQELPAMWSAGTVHLATALTTMIVPIAAAGGTIHSIAPQSDVAGAHQVVLGPRAQERVRSPKDFEDLKVGMPRGASVSMAIERMARDTGVDFAKIRFVDLTPPEAIKALGRGDIDAMAAWAPWVLKAVSDVKGKVAFTGRQSFLPGKEGPVEWMRAHAGVVASGQLVKERPDALKAVLRALVKATYVINNDRDTVVKLVADETKMEEWLARDLMELNVYSMELTDKHVKGMAEFVDFLHGLGRIKQKFPPESVFMTTLLEEVEPRLVKWKPKPAPR
jgi:NitT/TauT family transport system substrate-binding protein